MQSAARERNCSRCGAYFESVDSARMCPLCREQAREPRPINRNLSFRNKQVVSLVARGLMNKEIAYELRLTEGTVKEYLNRIFAKTGTRNRVELTVWWLAQAQS